MMKTTLNIHKDTLNKINLAAKSVNVSRSKMIILLLKEFMKDNKNKARLGMLVEYQDRDDNENWHLFHISFREDEYEYFTDLRKLMKMSLSLILSNAVIKFLAGHKLDLIKSDNYPFKNYVIIKEYIDNIICWKLIWGYAETALK